MKPISIDDVRSLVDHDSSACVSIYLPTERSGKETRQNPIRFRNLLRRAEQSLVDRRGLRTRQVEKLLRPAHDLVEDVPFWQHQSDGLAVFVSESLFRRYRVPLRLPELDHVGDRFYVKPLLGALASDAEFFILVLNRKDVRLVRSSRFRSGDVDLGHTPTGLAELLSARPGPRPVQLPSAAPGGHGERAAAFHGHGGRNEEPEHELRRFLSAVDDGVREALRDESGWLLLAGPEDLLSLYREVSARERVLPEELRVNAGEMRDDELRERAWSLVRRQLDREREAELDRLLERIGTGLASSDPREIVRASHDGRIRSLFVARGRHHWGRWDPDTRELSLLGDASRDDGGQDLLDLAAAQTLSHGGEVFVLDPERLPDPRRPAAAMFRY